MKIHGAVLLICTTIQILSMDSPGREVKSDSAKRRSIKGGSFHNSPAREGSPNSSVIIPRSTSMSPQGLHMSPPGSRAEIKKGSAVQIEQTVEIFAGSGTSEEELQKKLEEVKKLKSTNRFEYDSQLKNILEIKVNFASAAKFKAAQSLFESASSQVKIACDNFCEYKRNKNDSGMKTELLAILKARVLAKEAKLKEDCAAHPDKYGLWCDFDADINDDMLTLNEKIRKFMIEHKITETMKSKDMMMPSQPLP